MTAPDLDAPIPYYPTLIAVPDEPPTTQPTFTVDAIVEEDKHGAVTHDVQVTLSAVQWRMLLGDIARAFHRARTSGQPVTAKLVAAGHPDNDLARMDALTDLQRLLGMAPPAWLVAPEEAGTLALALADAAEERPECECGHLLPEGRTTCGRHR